MTWDQFHQKVAIALKAPEPKLVHIPSDVLNRLVPQESAITFYNFQYSNVYDNSLAKSDLNFKYTIPFIEGVQRTVAWLNDKGRIENSDKDPFDDRLIDLWENMVNNLEKDYKNS